MQKAMEQSGDTETRWTTSEIARQDLQDSWPEDAEAAGLDPEDTETRDQLWDMVVEAYFGPTAPTTPTTETLSWTAKVLAANLERMADDAIENDLTEDEEQTLRDVADRLQTETATDADWREAIQQVDLYGCAGWID